MMDQALDGLKRAVFCGKTLLLSGDPQLFFMYTRLFGMAKRILGLNDQFLGAN